ncbi:hypothetical protein [Microbacterium sp. 77mftsu3.1]|uniref:hypothetical protein n=1 Tax=Microbacterium sp. 77mftsu3.1 TaxID=1761802 RepID=UPI0008827529|nr:hypothetical protein [Microbacterium sp. 77mftsu3.1]SDH33623.1 hypothetical protein SAMN04488590_3061 [Microbacterium sp. 77mftsu3.1]
MTTHSENMPTPFRHISKSQRTLRDLRQGAGTVYHQLLALGFTPEDIAAEHDQYAHNRRISLSLAGQEGSDLPLVGVSYGGDFRAEEEWGIPEIAKALRAEEQDRVFSGERDGVWFLGLRADRGIRRWQPDERDYRVIETALRRSREEARDEHWRDRFLKVAELRQGLRDAGVTGPLPRTKVELQALFAERVREQHPLSNIGEFHNGDVLIMVPARPVITAVLRILAGSGKHLRMGGSASPFDRGATIYDERDLTNETVEASLTHAAYARKQNRKAEPIRKALAAKGYLFALSSPNRRDGVDRFWLNYSPHGHKQVSGWFTLVELQERVASGDWSRSRAAA